MLIDCHIHTRYSSDGRDEPEDVIKAAINAGACYIALTEHMDNMKRPDLDFYVRMFSSLKEKYKKQIYVAVGIECSWNKENELHNKKMLEDAGLEYIINSVHDINGSDCYYPAHYEGRGREEVYNEYFGAVLKSLDAPYKFHAVGHLAYVSRTAPYINKRIRYEDFKETLDVILTKIIKKDIILELNTNVYGAGSLTLPDFDIAARYKELGGKLITFSSDAHRINRLFDNYAAVAGKVKELGFKEWSVIREGKITDIEI